MAYDEALAERIRRLLEDEPGLTEKKMFGGLAFLINGNMSVAASGQGGLMVRCAPQDTDSFLEQPGAEQLVMRGRPMEGWLRVSDDAVSGEAELSRWVNRGTGYARSLPPK
jgi:TfoX/Sxy family transcriptional regulator of competence genes